MGLNASIHRPSSARTAAFVWQVVSEFDVFLGSNRTERIWDVFSFLFLISKTSKCNIKEPTSKLFTWFMEILRIHFSSSQREHLFSMHYSFLIQFHGSFYKLQYVFFYRLELLSNTYFCMHSGICGNKNQKLSGIKHWHQNISNNSNSQ